MQLRKLISMAAGLLALAVLAATAVSAGAETKTLRLPPARAAAIVDANISIMTEALPTTAGSDEDSVGELARAYWQAGLLRILPVRGLGPIANMRDLLHMRGIDMAVVDADILAYAQATGELPGASTRLSAVARLSDKTVYLVAAKGIGSVSDLSRQRVLVPGADSDSYVTARTLLPQLGVMVELAGTPLEVAIGELASGKAKAMLLTLEEDDGTLATLPPDIGLHVLPIPETAAVAAVYGRRTLGAGEAQGLVPASGLSTVTVAGLLATFNWRPGHVRYGPVLKFLQNLPKVIEQLRSTDPRGAWRAFDGRADVPGWPRYEPARPLLAGIVPQVAPLTSPQPAVKATETPATSSALASTSATGTEATKSVLQSTATPAAPAMSIELAVTPGCARRIRGRGRRADFGAGHG